MTTALLELEDVHAAYGMVEALHGVTLSIPQGVITSLLGPNGAGKTTLLRAICGVTRVTSGSVRLLGEDITNLKVEKTARRGILYQPGTREVFGSMTVRENLFSGCIGIAADEAARRLDLLREAFPQLDGRMKQRAGTMSGGEQQVVAVGRAFMANPRVLLLDEPSLGLAPATLRALFRQLKVLQRAVSMTVLLAEQNTRVSLQIADEVYVIKDGKIIDHREDPSDFTEEELTAAYLSGGMAVHHGARETDRDDGTGVADATGVVDNQ